MSRELVKLFQKTINDVLHLTNEDNKVWFLKETPKIEIEAPSEHSLGFSLDCKSFRKIFINPPSDIIRMCDAIIVLSYENKVFIFAIEQKAKHEGDYEKQLANGKYFCDWLLVLLKEHGHYDGEVVFISLLCWRPREKSPRKGGSHHGNKIRGSHHGNKIIGKKPVPFDRFFEVRNQNRVYLLKFIYQILSKK